MCLEARTQTKPFIMDMGSRCGIYKKIVALGLLVAMGWIGLWFLDHKLHKEYKDGQDLIQILFNIMFSLSCNLLQLILFETVPLYSTKSVFKFQFKLYFDFILQKLLFNENEYIKHIVPFFICMFVGSHKNTKYYSWMQVTLGREGLGDCTDCEKQHAHVGRQFNYEAMWRS